MGERLPDLVFFEYDGSDPEVLGADGFWASWRRAGWSDERPLAVPGIDPDRILVTDQALASKRSNEARQALWVRRIAADAERNAGPR